ncbi:MAG: porin family protein [Acidobacteriota bacterium]|nr:porin family protein [Acidobacteriota bacterium]
MLAALAAIVLTAAPGAAQTPAVIEPGVWTVTPFLSFTFGGDADSTSLGLGGAAAYDFTDRLGVEAELGWVFDLAGDTDTADWSTVTLGANAVYHFPIADALVIPYATAGIGLVRSSLTIEALDASSTEMGFNFGGGVKAPVSDAFSVRGDLRYFAFNDAGPDGWRLYGGLSWRLRRD